MQHRPEIDGLRAVAVLPVLFFHAGVPGFSGGYVGVDVFFVISGYLIARLIEDESAAGRFSLARFYERRARRILPALFTVMLACIPCAWVLFLPDDLESFGQSLVATTLMGNNFLLWRTSGYWDIAVEFKPLMHTWSLGIEEQFYLLFPWLALALGRWPLRWRLLAGLALATVGLAAAIAIGREDARTAFLMLPTRAWQLLLGAACAWAPASAMGGIRREVLAALGAGLLVLALALPPVPGRFPAPAAWAACAGAALLLRYAAPVRGVGRWLALPLPVGIGLVSYSLYLWHQPLLAFLRAASLDEPALWQSLLALCMAGALAMLSWRWIEQPFRDRRKVGPLAFAAVGIAVALLLLAVGLALHWNFRAGAPLRVKADVEGVGRWPLSVYNERPLQFENRPFTAQPGRRVLVVGNSFARDFINAGLENGYFGGVQLSYARESLACMSAPGAPALQADLALRIAQADVLVLGYDSIGAECWAADLGRLRAMGTARIVVLGVKDFGWNLNAASRLPQAQRPTYRAAPRADVALANRRDRALVGDGLFVDVLALLADETGRVPVFTPDGRFITGDRRHFTPAGARYAGALIFAHPLLQDLR